MDKLDEQVKENRKKFRVDHFDMVISEYIERYNRGDLVLDPPYQRLFRWDDISQSQLIESILIGIPLPPIFVFQNEDFRWEIIDGLQRTNTLIKMLGSNSEKIFQGCDIITELNGKKFVDLPENMQRVIRNTRIRIEVVEETDDIFSQYLLFNRLNSNGEKLSGQETRNFLIYKLNKNFYNKLQELSGNNEFDKSKNSNNYYGDNIFLKATHLNKERLEKQENMEYALKFFIGRELSRLEKIDRYDTTDKLLTKETDKYLSKYSDDYLINEYEIFKETFSIVYDVFGDNSFRHFAKRINSISSTFSISVGISFILDEIKSNYDKNQIIKISKDFYESEKYKKITSRGYSPTARMYDLYKYSRVFFKEAIE